MERLNDIIDSISIDGNVSTEELRCSIVSIINSST